MLEKEKPSISNVLIAMYQSAQTDLEDTCTVYYAIRVIGLAGRRHLGRRRHMGFMLQSELV